MWTIYEHIAPSGNIYVGITSKKVNDRWEKGAGYVKCKLFYRAIKKYGWDNIEHKVIASNLGEKTAKNMEIDLISFNKKKGISYNITDGGDGCVGIIASDKQREHAKNIWFGKKIPEEIRKKMSEGQKGISRSEEARNNIRKSKIGNKNRSKKLLFLDSDNNIKFKFDSCVDAGKYFNVHPNGISKCCRKDYGCKMFHGYVLMYENDYIQKNPYTENVEQRFIEIVK